MISPIGSPHANTNLPEGTGAKADKNGSPTPVEGDRANIGHRDLTALPPVLQDALHRALRVAPDAADSVAALTDAAQGPDVLDAVDGALNLNGGGAATLLGRLEGMSREEAEGVLNMLADLLRRGVVGYEYRRVNGEAKKVFIDAAIGSDWHRAPLVRGGRFDGLF